MRRVARHPPIVRPRHTVIPPAPGVCYPVLPSHRSSSILGNPPEPPRFTHYPGLLPFLSLPCHPRSPVTLARPLPQHPLNTLQHPLTSPQHPLETPQRALKPSEALQAPSRHPSAAHQHLPPNTSSTPLNSPEPARSPCRAHPRAAASFLVRFHLASLSSLYTHSALFLASVRSAMRFVVVRLMESTFNRC